ncbi:MAG: [protein-PII] uridylyltransferase [Alphaproteobacteria bacterium]|nr:[protein-PII] uridylyltransferase [Alphaproteobacteria bacterium]
MLQTVPAVRDPTAATPAGAAEAAPPAIAAALAELDFAATGPPLPPREAALAQFRRALTAIRTEVRRGFDAGETDGLGAAERLSAAMDGLIAALFRYAMQQHAPRKRAPAPQLAIIATGGYGRRVLAPFSDIDLLFLTARTRSPRTHAVVEFMLYFLWDLGLKVGHATRTVAECITQSRADWTVRTSHLDARLIVGERALFAEMTRRFQATARRDSALAFLAAKQAERAARHRRFGDSAYLLEPNLKEGKGGLRDLQTLFWMARFVIGAERFADLVPAGLLTEAELRNLMRTLDFFWSVRFALHDIAGRAEERLTFDMQPVLAARLGYTRHGEQAGVERFMKHYFLNAREVRRLAMLLEPAIEAKAKGRPAIEAAASPALAEQGFALEGGKIVLAPGRSFAAEPILLLALLRAARDTRQEIHPLTLGALIRANRHVQALRGTAEASAILLDLLAGGQDGARWLRLMNETGILGRLLPDWARIIGLMQFDTYHIYTVDEHTIEAIGILNGLETGVLAEIAPVASALIGKLGQPSRRALYAAMLLHDICKGRGGDHSELGAGLTMELGPRLGLTAEETETASWLVMNHLALSQTAFKRDIDDPKTIIDLAELVQSPERLRLLLIMTVADMRAVSAKVWNAWKATLLRELYWRVGEVLAGGLNIGERDQRVARAKEGVAAALSDWPAAQRDAFLGLGYPSYWLAFDVPTHVRHARLWHEAEAIGSKLMVETQVFPARGVTEVTVYTADHPGLFSRIAGALAVAGASIVDARIFTMTNGMALDTFWVQDATGGPLDAPSRLARLSAAIEQTLSGRLKVAEEIRKISRTPSRMRAITVPPRVVIDNHASATHTVIEVNGRDRPGLLHDVTAAITRLGLQIASAHVSTYGVRAVDVFYVKDVFGLRVENEKKLADLRAALLEALAAPDAGSPAAPAPAPASARARRRRLAARG